MSPLSSFLILVVSLTALVIVYLTNQFQEENIYYSRNNKPKNTNSNTNVVEEQKAIAEVINGRFAMIGLIAAVGAYLTTGQIIPGFI